MGTFHVDIEIGDPQGLRYEPVEALVDTGAAYTSVPQPLLEALGVVPHEHAWLQLADGRLVERALGRAWVRVGQRAEPTIVIFAEPGSPTLLGAYSLEGLRLAPDPVGRRLVPVTSLYLCLVES